MKLQLGRRTKMEAMGLDYQKRWIQKLHKSVEESCDRSVRYETLDALDGTNNNGYWITLGDGLSDALEEA